MSKKGGVMDKRFSRQLQVWEANKSLRTPKGSLNVILYTKVGDTGLLKTRAEAFKLLK